MGRSAATRPERILVFLFRRPLGEDGKFVPVRLKEIAEGIGEPDASNSIKTDLDRLRADDLTEILRLDASSVARHRLTGQGKSRAQGVLTRYPQIDVRAFDPSARRRGTATSVQAAPLDDAELRKSIQNRVRVLIAQHGFADPTWADAISSKYFLVELARLLHMEGQSDYRALLNSFLKSFDPTVENRLELSRDRILVTNDELDSIVNSMKAEDAKDDYFARIDKTKAQNIDPSALHFNYLHGLAAGITANSESRMLQMVNELALDELFKNGARALDEHGGWYPYRVPWITARVLTSLRQCDKLTNGAAPERMNEVNRALVSLVGRIHGAKCWRSGVGDWVSDWESTALCLEALHVWGAIPQHAKDIAPVLEHIASEAQNWLIDPPDFSDEARANQTLAAAVMASVVLRVAERNLPKTQSQVDRRRLLQYLSTVVDCLAGAGPSKKRQFCTVPQVAYYALAAVVEDPS